MELRTWILLISLATLASGCGDSASNGSLASRLEATLNFMNSNAISVTTALTPPPSNGSKQNQAELTDLLDLQASRSKADCKRADIEAKISLNHFFGPAYGPLSADEVTQLLPLFEKLQSDISYVATQQKDYWDRERPYRADPAVQPCVPLESGPSYPSNHSTTAHVFALLLDEIDPSRKAKFDARADQIAEDRVMGGVHYPSDVAAGKILAAEIFQIIKNNPVLLQDLKNLD